MVHGFFEINGTPVSTIKDEHATFAYLASKNKPSCTLQFSHPEITPGISNKGLRVMSKSDFSQLTHDQLTIPLKRQSLLDMVNGVDVVQTQDYIKISCQTYINKFCEKYLNTWLGKIPLSEKRPTPLPTDPTWLEKFNAAVGLSDPDVQKDLSSKMQIKYKAGVGKLIWAMTTCRPDISFTSVKLSQSYSAPAEHHYHGLKHAIRYVYIT